MRLPLVSKIVLLFLWYALLITVSGVYVSACVVGAAMLWYYPYIFGVFVGDNYSLITVIVAVVSLLVSAFYVPAQTIKYLKRKGLIL